MTFFAKPVTFQGDHEKVTFAASYLTETAQSHYTSLLQYNPDHPALHSWEGFIREFGGMFGVVNTQVEADQNLRMLQMGENERFSNHIIRFESFAFESNWNSAALQSELYRSLSTRIKEAMKVIPRPTTYQELRDLAMQIDQRHWEYESETRRTQFRANPPAPRPPAQQGGNRNFQTTSRPYPPAGNNPTTPRPATGNPATTPRPPIPPRQPNPNPNPPYVPLSDEERERRRQGNLCLRCGKPGHYSAACPDRRATGRAVFTLDEGEEELQEAYEVEEEVVEDVDDPHEELNKEATQEFPGEV
jgi:hypothetical protein